jgi:hypothetical protein
LRHGAPRHQPAHVRGTETEDTVDTATELSSEPSLVHLSDGLEGSFVVGHDSGCVIGSSRCLTKCASAASDL